MSDLPRCPCGRETRYLNITPEYGAASPWPACVGCGKRADGCTCAPGNAEGAQSAWPREAE